MPRTATEATPELLYLLHGDPDELAHAVRRMRAADIADALTRLRAPAAARVVAALPFDLAVQIFDEPLLAPHRCEIVRHLGEPVDGQLIAAMAPDQQVDLLRDLDRETRARLLGQLDPSARAALTALLAYEPDTAGGIMTTEFVSVPSTWSVERTLDHIRRVGRAKETVYAIFVVDPATQALVHVTSLRELMLAGPETPIMEAGDRRPPLVIAPDADQEDAARMISRYDLLALPVVDDALRLLGIVTVDDVIDALVREQTEDVQKLGGMEALEHAYMRTSIVSMVRKRVGWLSILFFGGLLTTAAIARYEVELSRAILLLAFIPLIISSGGNSGSQATSLVIRALAIGEIRLRDWWRVAVRELTSGLILGVVLGALGVFRVVVWHRMGWTDYGPHYWLVGATIGVALVGVVTFGSFVGAMLPFILSRLRLDPASASAPFVATLVDVTGLIIYFSVAAVVLSGTLL